MRESTKVDNDDDNDSLRTDPELFGENEQSNIAQSKQNHNINTPQQTAQSNNNESLLSEEQESLQKRK